MKQFSYDPLDLMDSGTDFLVAHKAMQQARDHDLRQLRKEHGKQAATGWTLRNQIRPYKSFGVPDGSVRNVYFINQYID